MRKIFILLFIVLAAFPLLANGDVVESDPEQQDAVFTLVWNPNDTAYLVFGLTSQQPQGYTWVPNQSDEADIFVNNPARSGTGFFATNTISLYAFCNAYANVRFNINVSCEPFSNGSGTPIPFTISWDGGGYIESGDEPEVMFNYIPTDGAYSQYRTLTILTQLPESAASMEYRGKVILALEVL